MRRFILIKCINLSLLSFCYTWRDERHVAIMIYLRRFSLFLKFRREHNKYNFDEYNILLDKCKCLYK